MSCRSVVWFNCKKMCCLQSPRELDTPMCRTLHWVSQRRDNTAINCSIDDGTLLVQSEGESYKSRCRHVGLNRMQPNLQRQPCATFSTLSGPSHLEEARTCAGCSEHYKYGADVKTIASLPYLIFPIFHLRLSPFPLPFSPFFFPTFSATRNSTLHWYA